MSPGNRLGMMSQAARAALFAAIAEGRFDRISRLTAEYKQQVKDYLVSRNEQGSVEPLPDFVKPLSDALCYLRIVRAHQSARFQKLAVDTVYRSSVLANKGRTLDIGA